MENLSIETMSFADLYAVHQYVKDKIEAIKEDHQLDLDEPTIVLNPQAGEGPASVTMVPEIGDWGKFFTKLSMRWKID